MDESSGAQRAPVEPDATLAPVEHVAPVGVTWRRAVAFAVAVIAAVASLGVLVAQVEVSEQGATRTCGSAFDSVTDRAGWEQWWARDLDEPDAGVRAALVRTRRCPDAVNGRLAVSGLLATIAITGFAAATWHRRPRAEGSGSGPRIVRLGRVTAWAGTALTLGGSVAIVALVADADSTLFLYTDRLVVGVVGLIVLMPALALVVLGRVLVIVGEQLANQEHPDA